MNSALYFAQIVLRGVPDQRAVRISASENANGTTRLQIDGGEANDGSSLDWQYASWAMLQAELDRMLRQYLASDYMVAAQQVQLPEPLMSLPAQSNQERSLS